MKCLICISLIKQLCSISSVHRMFVFDIGILTKIENIFNVLKCHNVPITTPKLEFTK